MGKGWSQKVENSASLSQWWLLIAWYGFSHAPSGNNPWPWTQSEHRPWACSTVCQAHDPARPISTLRWNFYMGVGGGKRSFCLLCMLIYINKTWNLEQPFPQATRYKFVNGGKQHKKEQLNWEIENEIKRRASCNEISL